MDDYIEEKKEQVTKKCVTKRKLKFDHCKKCLKATQLENEKPMKTKTTLVLVIAWFRVQLPINLASGN